MHITRYTDYSLRVLMYIALKGDELSTIREISDSYGISKNHLMKVVHQLTVNGYLIAQRGKHGGLRLNGRPKDIKIGDLVRDTEQDRVLVECFGVNDNCVISPACTLKSVFADALEAFFKVLDKHTLADLLPANRKPKLLRLLEIA
ncbi:MAG: Rrf2 family transcriptional regulator [Gammaproteobacteria bacterium]|nr:Rrf2 family transcriptional regulator [Gammaproteobacteria bacterium]